MRKIAIPTSKPYDVHIDRGILAKSGELIKNIYVCKKIAIITDDIVMSLHGDTLRKSLDGSNISYHFFEIPNGEKSKNISILSTIYDFLIANEFSRSDLIIAFGGGVVGDIAGFAAATYLRGVAFVQIPTTLIAQTDSSVGGKTAINSPLGKNLIGSFYQPKLVICDTEILDTLSDSIFNEGVAEVIKYALLADASLFSQLENMDIKSNIDDIVANCVQIKADIVCNDEFDLGNRMLLNLGHTIGHSVENHSEYNVLHGAGVAIGMAIMLGACVQNDILPKTIYDRLICVLQKFSLPTEYKSASLDELVQLAFSDKKRESDHINIIICRNIGNCEVKKIRLDELYTFLNKQKNL